MGVDVKQLRIGNYVKICFTEKQGWEWVRVTNIHADGTIDTDTNHKTRYYYEPIKLTDAILLSSGFKHDRIYRYRFELGTFVLARTMKDWSGPPTKANECFSLALDYGNQLSTQTEYLHQLQNLYYALTGEELDVKPLTQ